MLFTLDFGISIEGEDLIQRARKLPAIWACRFINCRRKKIPVPGSVLASENFWLITICNALGVENDINILTSLARVTLLTLYE
jgi:hypothetical protein